MIATFRMHFWLGVALRAVQVRERVGDVLTRVHEAAMRRGLGVE